MPRLISCVIVILVLLTPPVPASAQTPRPVSGQPPRPERPYRGLFGGGTGDTEQLLTVSASAGGGYDDNLIADARGDSNRPHPSDLNTTYRGAVGQFSGHLEYSLDRDWLTVGASGGSSARYYPSLNSDILRRDYGTAATTVRLATGLSANASATYSPYSFASLFPAPGDPSSVDAPVFDEDFASSTPAPLHIWRGPRLQ